MQVTSRAIRPRGPAVGSTVMRTDSELPNVRLCSSYADDNDFDCSSERLLDFHVWDRAEAGVLSN
jgi:hypothetical protein